MERASDCNSARVPPLGILGAEVFSLLNSLVKFLGASWWFFSPGIYCFDGGFPALLQPLSLLSGESMRCCWAPHGVQGVGLAELLAAQPTAPSAPRNTAATAPGLIFGCN